MGKFLLYSPDRLMPLLAAPKTKKKSTRAMNPAWFSMWDFYSRSTFGCWTPFYESIALKYKFVKITIINFHLHKRI